MGRGESRKPALAPNRSWTVRSPLRVSRNAPQLRPSFPAADLCNDLPLGRGVFAIKAAALFERRLEKREGAGRSVVLLDDRQPAFSEKDVRLAGESRIEP